VLAGLGEQLPANKGFICFNSLYKKKPGCRFKSFWQPGYLQETRGFPSLPCGRFGISHIVKYLSTIERFVKHFYKVFAVNFNKNPRLIITHNQSSRGPFVYLACRLPAISGSRQPLWVIHRPCKVRARWTYFI
jgi:hypothetical protein